MEIALQRVKEPLANAQNPPQTALVLTKRHVMGDMEKSLVDRCLKRALDWSGKPYTEHHLVERCSLDISYHGPEARTSVRMKGVRGYPRKDLTLSAQVPGKKKTPASGKPEGVVGKRLVRPGRSRELWEQQRSGPGC